MWITGQSATDAHPVRLGIVNGGEHIAVRLHLTQVLAHRLGISIAGKPAVIGGASCLLGLMELFWSTQLSYHRPYNLWQQTESSPASHCHGNRAVMTAGSTRRSIGPRLNNFERQSRLRRNVKRLSVCMGLYPGASRPASPSRASGARYRPCRRPMHLR